MRADFSRLLLGIGFVAGILLPALVLFGLGIHYVASGAPLQTILSMKTLIPDFSKLPTLVVFVCVLQVGERSCKTSPGSDLADSLYRHPQGEYSHDQQCAV